MELKSGYIQSELGIIPEDWEVKPLAEIAQVKTGPFGSSLHASDYVYDGTPIITVEHLSEFGVEHNNLPLVSDNDRRRLKSYSLKEGDIVFSRVGSVDRNAIVSDKEDGWLFSGRLLRVRVENAEVWSRYLSYYFHDEPFKQRVRNVAVGQTMPSLNTQILKSLDVVLPTLHEQRAIAAALGDVAALIVALDALVAKKRDLKIAAMQQLLIGKQRLAGFSGEWETRKYGDIFQFLQTANNSRADLEYLGDIQYIHYGDIHTQDSAFFSCDTQNLPYIDRAKLKQVTYLNDGDLVMVDASEDYEGVGKSIEVKGIGSKIVVAGLHTILMRGDNRELAHGFKAYLQFIPTIKQQLQKVATGISVYGISKSHVKSIEVQLPPVEEQTAIAEVLSDMDAEIAALEARRDKTRDLKRGMMQELLTGRTRLMPTNSNSLT